MAEEETTEETTEETQEQAEAQDQQAEDQQEAQEEQTDDQAEAGDEAEAAEEVEEEKGPEGPDPSLSPVQRRAWYRNRQQAEAKSERSDEERHADRVAERKAKAAARSRRRAQEREKRKASPDYPKTGTPAAESEPGRRQVRQGIVVSDKGDKTIVVRIDSAKGHRKYQKIVRSSTKLHVHDERNEAGEGDTVRVISARPISKTKRWRLESIVERAK